MRTRCSRQCQSIPESGLTSQTFERRGSSVKVILRRIPASICPVCQQTYISRETGHQIDLLLEPFHGNHKHIPALPPAEVLIDFSEAVATLKAA